MPASVTNKALNTASVTNNASRDITWDSALYNWDDPLAGWDTATNFSNRALNTATMTNLAQS